MDRINYRNSFFFEPSRCSSLDSSDKSSDRSKPVIRLPAHESLAPIFSLISAVARHTRAVKICPTSLTLLQERQRGRAKVCNHFRNVILVRKLVCRGVISF